MMARPSKKIASEEYPEMKETDKDGIVEHKLTFAPVTTQYVRVIALTGENTSGMAWRKKVKGIFVCRRNQN